MCAHCGIKKKTCLFVMACIDCSMLLHRPYLILCCTGKMILIQGRLVDTYENEVDMKMIIIMVGTMVTKYKPVENDKNNNRLFIN